MHKNIIAVLLLGAIVLGGCASLGSIKDPAAVDPVGLVTVRSNAEITWYGESQEEEGGGLLGNLLSKKVAPENETVDLLLGRTTDLLAYGADKLNQDLSALSSVAMVEKEKIVNTATYTAIDDGLMDITTVRIAEGYKHFGISKKDLIAGIAAESGVKGEIFVDYAFEKLMLAGVGENGKMGAAVTMNVNMVNPEGKLVFYKSYFAKSKEGIPVALRVYNPEDLMPLYYGLIDDLSRQFAAEFSF